MQRIVDVFKVGKAKQRGKGDKKYSIYLTR